MILVDSNVLLDVVTNDPAWYEWSVRQLALAALHDDLAINPVVYAEVSIRYDRIEEVDAMLVEARTRLIETPRQALFRAGKAHSLYRSHGGTRTGVLPDFFIGAHAAVMDWVLLTRDARRYRTYFPDVDIVAPG